MQDVTQQAQQERESKMRFDEKNDDNEHIPPPPVLRREQAAYRHPAYDHHLSFL